MKNKRLLFGIVMLLFIGSALAVNAGAGRNIGNWIDDRFNSVGNRFGSSYNTGLANIPYYDNNAQLIDFLIFLILFTSITTIGLKKGFSQGKDGESQNAVKAQTVIVILVEPASP